MPSNNLIDIQSFDPSVFAAIRALIAFRFKSCQNGEDDTKFHLPTGWYYGRVSDFLLASVFFHKDEEYLWWFSFFCRISNWILSAFFSLSYLVFRFFVLVIFVFVSDHTEKERKRERINRLCHSDIAKMMFDYIIIHYLFILLLLSSIHLTVSQTTIEFSSDEPTGTFWWFR